MTFQPLISKHDCVAQSAVPLLFFLSSPQGICCWLLLLLQALICTRLALP